MQEWQSLRSRVARRLDLVRHGRLPRTDADARNRRERQRRYAYEAVMADGRPATASVSMRCFDWSVATLAVGSVRAARRLKDRAT
jgi:hypothetical protein